MRRRLLFILSHDFGELFNAMYFVEGGALDPVFAMPPRLAGANRKGFSHRAYSYQSAAEIDEIVARESPELILLFSGYLYVVNKVLDQTGFEHLVDTLRQRGSRLATSDPSLGLMSQVNAQTFRSHHPARARLEEHFARVFELLKGVVHLYLAPLTISSPVRHLSYFNPQAIQSDRTRIRIHDEVSAWPGIDRAKRRWLFILSPEDYGIQTAQRGEDAFVDLLARHVMQTAQNGRQPLVIAPLPCVRALRERCQGIRDLVAVSGCDYRRFMLLLYEAEYVLYWNLFSASVLARLINRMPVFFFSRGHLVNALAPFLQVGMEHFYPACKINLLDPEECLAENGLEEQAGAYAEHLYGPVLENLARCDRPEAVVETIVAGSVGE